MFYNRKKPQNHKIVSRIRFSIWELFLLVANIILASYLFHFCEGHALSAIAMLASCLNIFRLVRRIVPFRMSWYIVMKSLVLILQNSVLFVIYIVVLGIVGYSVFVGSIKSCKLPAYRNISDRAVGVLHSSFVSSRMVHGQVSLPTSTLSTMA